MYKQSSKLISQSMLKKGEKMQTDGQTDGLTDGHNTSVFSNGRIKTKLVSPDDITGCSLDDWIIDIKHWIEYIAI